MTFKKVTFRVYIDDDYSRSVYSFELPEGQTSLENLAAATDWMFCKGGVHEGAKYSIRRASMSMAA